MLIPHPSSFSKTDGTKTNTQTSYDVNMGCTVEPPMYVLVTDGEHEVELAKQGRFTTHV